MFDEAMIHSLKHGGQLNLRDLGEITANLERGGVAMMGSESGYFIGADARNEGAVRAVRALTGIPEAPLSVECGTGDTLERIVRLDFFGRRIAESLLPGPLTIVAPRRARVKLAASLGPKRSIGVRLSSSPVDSQVARKLGAPITSTALRDDRGDIIRDFGEATDLLEITAAKAQDTLGAFLSIAIVKAERFTCRQHSTVVEVGGERPFTILRQGATDEDDIRSASLRISRWEWGGDGT